MRVFASMIAVSPAERFSCAAKELVAIENNKISKMFFMAFLLMLNSNLAGGDSLGRN